MYNSFACYAQGESHKKNNDKPCQDYAKASGAMGYNIITASDGHGGEKYFRSNYGARIACDTSYQCAFKCITTNEFTDVMENPSTPDSVKERMIIKLAESVISNWGKEVEKHLAIKPFTDEELVSIDKDKRERMNDFDYAVKAYGATLILAVVSEKFWFGLQIGDGTLVTVSDKGDYNQPIELDELCTGNITTSICNDAAINYVHFAWGNEPLQAVLIATDGVDESFASEEAFYNFYRHIINGAQTDFDETVKDLQDYLPTLSKRGSKDDVSIAGAIRFGAISGGTEDDRSAVGAEGTSGEVNHDEVQAL